MDIKDILGEGYKEGMTVDEINVALADKELIDKSVLSGYVSKDTADKYATEAANFKKQLREKLTEDEAAKARETEEREAMAQELKSLKQKNAITENEKRLLAIGYDADLATKTAEAMANGDTQKVFDNQAKHIEIVQKNLRAELLKEMPTPPTGGGDSATMKEAFDKMTLTEKAKFKLEKPDEYKMIIGGNK